MSGSWRARLTSLIDKPAFWPLALAAGSFSVYAATLPRTVSFEDSAEFVTAAATFGLPHPSGFPLYVLLARIFVWLPFGTIPWRVALFSAVCASGAVVLAFILARRLAASVGAPLTRLSGLAMSAVLLQLAFSEIWWSQAIYAKVYALHALLLLGAAWCLARYVEDVRSVPWLAGGVFLFGCALANHLFLALAALPFFIFAVCRADRGLCRPSKKWLLAGLALAVGLLPYAVLYLRALADPPYVMGAVNGWRDFADHVLRRRYADLDAAAWQKTGLSFVLLWQLLVYLGPLPVFLAAVGVWRSRAAKNRRAAAVLVLCLGGVLSAPLALLTRSTDWTDTSAYLSRVYGLAGYAFTAVLAAAGLAWLLRAGLRSTGRAAGVLAAVLLLSLPAAGLVGNWPKMAPYRSPFVEAYGRELLGRLPPGAVLVVNDYSYVHDTELFVLAYLQTIQGWRADVTVVQDAGISCLLTPVLPAGYENFSLDLRRRLLLEKVLADPDLAGRPVYSTFAPEYVIKGLSADSNGLAFRVSAAGARGAVADLPAEPLPSLPDMDMLRRQPALGLLVSHALYNHAAALVEEQGNKAAVDELVAAIGLDTAPMSDDFRGFMAHRAAVAPLPPR